MEVKIESECVFVQVDSDWKMLGPVSGLNKNPKHLIIELKSIGISDAGNREILELRKQIEIQKYYGQPKKQKNRLGQGIIEDYFYYATEVEEDDKPKSSLVVSDGKGEKEFHVGENIKDELGINYTSEFDEDALSYPWENDSVKNYLGNKTDKVDILQLLETQRKLWKKFVYFPDEREYFLHPCYVVNTYCYTLFTHQARIDFRGQTESGKSTASKVYKLTAFNSIWVNKASDAARFRDLEATCGTLIIDNFDNLSADVKNDIQYFIEVSFDREGGTKRIMEAVGNSKFRGKTLRVYGPMVVNSKMGYAIEDSTLNRLITTTMGKHKMPKLDTKLKEWEKIRNDSRVFVLDNWREIQKVYETLETGFDSRAEDIYKPILTIAKMAGEEYYNNVLTLLREKHELMKENQGEDDFEREVLALLLETVGEQKSVKVAVPDLAEKLIETHFGFDREQDRNKFMGKKKYCGTIVKNILRNIPALNKQGRTSHPGNRLTFLVFQKEVVEYMQVRGYLKEGENPYANLNQY